MLPIVTYHAIGEEASPVWTPLATFEAQLDAFARRGYRGLTLSTALDALGGRAPLPERSVVFTFDDGYESVHRLAWPRLRAHGFVATVFLIGDYCGRDNRWPGQPPDLPVAPLLTWEQARDLTGDGWEVGAHTRTHPALPALPLDGAEREIVGAQREIALRLDRPARAFAYPYGATTPAVTGVARRHFAGAVGTDLGLACTGDDPYRLPRIDAHYLHPRLIPFLRAPSFARYLRLRQALRATRRRFRPDWRPASAEGAFHA